MFSQGVKYILTASLLFGTINALVKYFSYIPSIQIVFFRSLVTLILSFYVIQKNEIKIFDQNIKLLLARGLAGAIALILYFSTIQSMPLATAVTILYLAPIFTVILSIFINNESPKSKQWPFILLGFLGAGLMKGFDPRVSLTDFLMGICAAFFAGLAYNLIRKLRDRCHHQLIIFYFPLVTLPIILPFLNSNWSPLSLLDLSGLILIGILTQMAQVYMTKAYFLEEASKISHFNYLTCVYALLSGAIFFNESIKLISLIGMIVIIMSVILSSKFSKS